jgi:hypothetical protein
MVSNALSRRRHVIKPPSVCKSGWPATKPVAPYGTCDCNVGPWWNASELYLDVTWTPWLTSLPNDDPVQTWVQSDPELAWTPPYLDKNHSPRTVQHLILPPGTTSFYITVTFLFSNGHLCSAVATIPTPGA